MRVPIELTSTEDVKAFTEICQTVDVDVRLVGKDENGNPWELSAKSLLCSLMLPFKAHHRHTEHTAHDVDWNTIWCECEKDIYVLIQKYVRDHYVDKG